MLCKKVLAFLFLGICSIITGQRNAKHLMPEERAMGQNDKTGYRWVCKLLGAEHWENQECIK